MLTSKETVIISKFLSKVLRHSPELINLNLNDAGWASVDELIEKSRTKNIQLDMLKLEHVVANNNKKRFAFNSDKTQIKAHQGHSIKIDHGFKAIKPPEILFHGTAKQNISSIQKLGLQKRNRHHVHLSAEPQTAINVGQRHGFPVIFKVQSLEMFNKGFEFYKSDNGVWLTNNVPEEFLELS